MRTRKIAQWTLFGAGGLAIALGLIVWPAKIMRPLFTLTGKVPHHV